MTISTCRLLAFICLAALFSAATSATGIKPDGASGLLQRAGIRGGVACVIGADQVDSAVGLARDGGFIVHLLDPDPAKVAAAREKVAAAGLLGRSVCVEVCLKDKLPHADNLVDLVVAGGAAGVPRGRDPARSCPRAWAGAGWR